jgi:AcrR family transcriptional regulator
LSTGLDLLEAGGSANLSLRKIATALDTGSASLYVYVESLDHLKALMLDAAYGEITYRADLPPGERVEAALKSLLDVLLRRRGLARIAAGSMPEGENWLRLNESSRALSRSTPPRRNTPRTSGFTHARHQHLPL